MCAPAHLELPDLLALLGDLPHRLAHQSDQHVEQQHKGEDDVGHQQDEKHCGVLGAVDHVQLSHANGQLKEVQQEGAEGVGVPAVWVGGTVAFALGAGRRAHRQQRHQGCGVRKHGVSFIFLSFALKFLPRDSFSTLRLKAFFSSALDSSFFRHFIWTSWRKREKFPANIYICYPTPLPLNQPDITL